MPVQHSESLNTEIIDQMDATEETAEDLIKAADETAEALLIRMFVLVGQETGIANDETANFQRAAERVYRLAEQAVRSYVERSESIPAHVVSALEGTRSSPRTNKGKEPALGAKLAPADSREVVRCDRCLLIQFRTSNKQCRRCCGALDEDSEVVAAAESRIAPGNGRGHLNLATSVRSLRLRSGLSQRQLAARMSVPRTYVSQIENEKATPTLSALERLARALEVTVPDLLSGGERHRQEEIGELMKDQFIAELMPFVSRLNGMQLSSVLAQVRDLTLRPRRSA
jgi:transcriptional regulator with XRE-family HTH domain